jgi:hypothetical protein
MGGQKGKIHRGAAQCMAVVEICRYIEFMEFLCFFSQYPEIFYTLANIIPY